jgi:hypothetical protein
MGLEEFALKGAAPHIVNQWLMETCDDGKYRLVDPTLHLPGASEFFSVRRYAIL